MTLLELKRAIHEKIDGLEDEGYLEMLNDMISHKDDVFVIPEHMKEGIRQGKEDGKQGRVHSMADFDKKYDKWLKD